MNRSTLPSGWGSSVVSRSAASVSVRSGSSGDSHPESPKRLDGPARESGRGPGHDAIPGKVAVGCEINQMAMYDFDAAQWHFISLEVFDQIMDDKEA